MRPALRLLAAGARTAARALKGRPAAGKAGRCRCGRRAEPGRETCRPCGSWLEGYLSQPDATPDFGAERSWRMAEPPDLPPGETIGGVDMTGFETNHEGS